MNILALIWLFLPAGIANMAPIFVSKLPWLSGLNFPMDFYIQYKGKRLLGDHKTIRGMISGVFLGIITVWIQKELYGNSEFVRTVSLLDYSAISALLLGTLLGAGALIGDAVESFFKRQMGIESGKSWFPYDQIDYIIGAAIFIVPIHTLRALEYVLLLITFFILHILFTFIGYNLKLKKDPL